MQCQSWSLLPGLLLLLACLCLGLWFSLRGSWWWGAASTRWCRRNTAHAHTARLGSMIKVDFQFHNHGLSDKIKIFWLVQLNVFHFQVGLLLFLINWFNDLNSILTFFYRVFVNMCNNETLLMAVWMLYHTIQNFKV